MWEGEIPLPVVPPWTEISVAGRAGRVGAAVDVPTPTLRTGESSSTRVTRRARSTSSIEVVPRSASPGRSAMSSPSSPPTGDTFGEQALVDRSAFRSATVTALDNCETLAMDIATAERLRAEHRGFDRFLLTILSARLRVDQPALLEALYLPADVRVFRCLCRLAAIFGLRNVHPADAARHRNHDRGQPFDGEPPAPSGAARRDHCRDPFAARSPRPRDTPSAGEASA